MPLLQSFLRLVQNINLTMNIRFSCVVTGSVMFLLLVISPMAFGQQLAVKVNSIYAATSTPNIGVEVGLGENMSMDIQSGLNIFTFSSGKKAKHWLLQPELRWWLCERFNGHFFGIHSHASQFNVGGWDIPLGRLTAFKDARYQGYLYGGGLSYGYQWLLNERFNLEANAGMGYARIHYEEYPCTTCGTKRDNGIYNYWGLTRLGLSLIYLLK